jgi:hypothetical protein
MDSKLLSKTNMGGVATIILVILLCQARFFNFMVGTTLGRAVLVFLVLGITCAHHILGVIAVLAIIVIYNQSNVDYMEGFTKGSAGDKSMGVASVMPAADAKPATKPAAMPATMPAAKPATMPAADAKKPAEKAVAREGFNLIDRERVMQKGKRASDLIGVADTRQQSDAVEPNDPSCFADQAAQF